MRVGRINMRIALPFVALAFVVALLGFNVAITRSASHEFEFAPGVDVSRDRDGPLRKVGRELADIHAMEQAGGYQEVSRPRRRLPPGQRMVERVRFTEVSNGFVTVDAIASGDVAELREDLLSLGLQAPATSGRTVSGRLPLGAIDALAALDSLQFARSSAAVTFAGSVTSQGDVAMRADIARASSGVDGTRGHGRCPVRQF